MSLVFDVGMAIAPITGYVMQYRLILGNKSVGAFSSQICLVLLFANIMRINFYIFRQYELALFFQSLFMITAQIMLVRLCIVYREPELQVSEEALEERITKKVESWKWDKFQDFIKYIVGFAMTTLFISFVMRMIGFDAYGDLIGMVALLSESVLILPQIIQIFKQKRAEGISYSLLVGNLIGDVIKTFYFFMKDQPFQFKLCGIIQLVLDSFVLLQMAYFNRSESEQGQEQQLKKQAVGGKEIEQRISQRITLQQNLESAERNGEDENK